MVGELCEEAAVELIDEDFDDQVDPLDGELEVDDDFETWCMIRRYLPTEPQIGD